MSESTDWDRGFWAGLAATVVGVFVGVLIALHLMPKPSPAPVAAAQPDAPQAPEPKVAGFHAAMKSPPAPADEGKA